MAQLAELLEQINALKSKLDQLRPLDTERESRVLQKFRLWWTYHSNAIEGNSLSQGETEVFLMEGLTAKGKPLKDHLDLKGHNDAINFLLALVNDERPLTETDIRELHRILLVETYKIDAVTPDGQPSSKMVAIGQYKTSANHVKTPTGEIHYYATPEETPAKMHDLMNWYRKEIEQGTTPTPFVVAKFHHMFTAIHPFDDGNGRMSRLLMNLMLMQEGYPPAVIRLSERNTYLAALRLADRGEYDEFISFISEHIVDALELYIRAANGESVSEPTDLKKEIALEILRLKHVEEPAERTRDYVYNLCASSITKLFQGTVELLAPFCDLFSSSSVTFSSGYGNKNTATSRNDSYELKTADFKRHFEQCFQGDMIISSTMMDFNFRGFKKARFNTFDMRSIVQIHFEQLKYTVSVQANPDFSATHFYQEELEDKELTIISERVAQHLLKEIQQNTQDKDST